MIEGEEIEITLLYPLLFGGDQLTVKNARSAKAAMAGTETSVDRLEGLIPVSEDWHARLCLLTVSA